MIIIEILFIFLAIFFAFWVGFLTYYVALQTKSYGGVIHVTKTDDKLLYSLELYEDPEQLQFMKKVVFKVTPLEESSKSQIKLSI